MASLVESGPLSSNPFSEPGVPVFVNPTASSIPGGPVAEEVGPLSGPTDEPGTPQLLGPPAAALFDGGPLDEFVGPLYQPVTQSGPTTMISSGGGPGPFGGGAIVGIVTP